MIILFLSFLFLYTLKERKKEKSKKEESDEQRRIRLPSMESNQEALKNNIYLNLLNINKIRKKERGKGRARRLQRDRKESHSR